MIFVLAACSQDAPVVEPSPVDTPPVVQKVTLPAVDTTPKEEEPTGPVNPLTGLIDGIEESKTMRKPVAIMINNLKQSLPQCGISKADIIYEMLAEGRISRFLAIFQDSSDVGRIGTVRSSRPYYIDVAMAYNAIYMHFGASELAYNQLSKNRIVWLDGIRGGWEGSLYYRDAERRKKNGLEHSVFTTGERIEEALSKLKSPIDLDEPVRPFNFDKDHSAKAGTAVSEVKVPYSSYISPSFIYDGETGLFNRFQFGEPHMDAEYDAQVAVKNLFILKMKTANIKNSSLGWITIDTTGKGDGYYVCDGKYIPISWSRDDTDDMFKYTVSDGSELKVCPGNTFICVAPTSTEIEFDGTAEKN